MTWEKLLFTPNRLSLPLFGVWDPWVDRTPLRERGEVLSLYVIIACRSCQTKVIEELQDTSSICFDVKRFQKNVFRVFLCLLASENMDEQKTKLVNRKLK